jgi:exopolysaccharide biosynthesis polyprenyl glycosylphosphotransferase
VGLHAPKVGSLEANTIPVAVRLADPTTTVQRRPVTARNRVARSDALRRRLLAAADLGAAVFSILLCVAVVGDDRIRGATLLGVLLVVPISKIIGLYERDEVLIHRTTIDEAPTMFQLAAIYTLTFWLLSPELIFGSLGRNQVLALWLTFAGTGILARYGVRRLADHAFAAERCLLVGDTAAASQLVDTMARNDLEAKLVGRMDTAEWTDPVSFRQLSRLIDEHDVDRIIIAPDDAHPQTMLDLIRASKGLGVRVSILPRVLEVVGSNVEFDNLGGMPLLGVRAFRLSRSSTMIKRGFDLIGASVGLLLAAPLFLVAAMVIKLDSRGPVFFRQIRVGRDGQHFGMIKFRTMVPDADGLKLELAALNEAEGLFKMADDPRITRVGKFLRRASIDEIPQLLNVVRGEMSLVGPRPLILDEDAKVQGFDRRRLNLTPGMTGHWQILGSARVPLGEMVKIDYLYVAGWSLWADIKLLLRTIPYVMARRGQ